MNIVSRLSFVLFSVISLAIFANSFTSLDKLSDGQSLMLWSLVPASLMLFTAAFHTKECANEVIALMVMFVGAFFATLSFGMYKQSGEVAYCVFAWLGLMLCGTSVAMVVLSTIPRASFSRS